MWASGETSLDRRGARPRPFSEVHQRTDHWTSTRHLHPKGPCELALVRDATPYPCMGRILASRARVLNALPDSTRVQLSCRRISLGPKHTRLPNPGSQLHQDSIQISEPACSAPASITLPRYQSPGRDAFNVPPVSAEYRIRPEYVRKASDG